MNGLRASVPEFKAMIEGADTLKGQVDLLVCPPSTLLSEFASMAGKSGLMVGGQDCHQNVSGAHTGDISAQMLADSGATFVIVGHSERRADHNESNAIVLAKAEAALNAGLIAIICVGETDVERVAGKTLSVVATQIAGSVPESATPAMVVIAYEPIWAIGTGKTPTTADVATVHAAIRKQLVERFGDKGSQMRLLYGGSVKPSNAAELLSVVNVNGALIGGASLKAADFLAIAKSVT